MDEQRERMFDEAAKQFNSSGKALKEDVNRLQEWLETQPHLPKMLDEHALRNFMILNKCSIEIAKKKIDNYYSVRAKVPEVVYEMNPKRQHHKEFKSMVYLVDHPQLTNDMYKLTFFKVKGETVSLGYEPLNFMRKLCSMAELKLRHDVMYGDILVLDCKGFTLNVAMRITPLMFYKLFVVLYDGVMSSRVKAVHILNMTPSITKLIQIAKAVMKPKIFERICIHSNEDALKKVIPLNLLPTDYGGEGLSLQKLEDALEAKYAQNQELFDRLDEITVNEELRPEKLENDDTLGFYGSFKKIDID
ncbi:retinaldehyde-binding protein 1-like [Zophobas morio]|uniref:retinaldehyde-binding protein 1-like n=1 Tax=Zophobas morio TaxID=2755281 RepID=UPI0030828A7F